MTTTLLIPLLVWDQIWVPIVLALLSGGTVAAVLNYRTGQKKAPIDSAVAAAAISEKAGNMALAIAERQDRDISGLRTDVKQQRKDMDAMAAELAKKSELLDKVINVLHGFREWYDGKIVQQWETVRQQPVPPDPPLEMKHWDDNYSSFLD